MSRAGWLALAAALAGAACASSPPASSAPGEAWAPSADAGGCEDRARVRPLCVQAMRERCRAQVQACESSCETPFGTMPGNSDKEPGLRGDIESAACRERCGSTYSPCEGSELSRCPARCAP